MQIDNTGVGRPSSGGLRPSAGHPGRVDHRVVRCAKIIAIRTKKDPKNYPTYTWRHDPSHPPFVLISPRGVRVLERRFGQLVVNEAIRYGNEIEHGERAAAPARMPPTRRPGLTGPLGRRARARSSHRRAAVQVAGGDSGDGDPEPPRPGDRRCLLAEVAS